jgi:class 3 adenylate cyclase/pimeloyl-ACP methyl ester carboxylesterase
MKHMQILRTYERHTRDVQPETRYAKSGDVSIAYQVAGEGPFDVVLVPGSLSHVEMGWTVPSWARWRHGLAEFSRLIIFDKRGTGMSDRLTESTTFEQRMDDIRAVMDAAGSERAALVGTSEGAPMAVLFAATYPARATALVLYGSFARALWAPDYPLGVQPDDYEREIQQTEASWGRQEWMEGLVRSALPGADEEEVRVTANVLRYAASPGAAADLDRLNASIDVRAALPAIAVPTLVAHQTGDQWVRIEEGRFVADHIAGARFLELPGEGHMIAPGNIDSLLREIRTFLEDTWAGGWAGVEPDRVLATVLFTDIVDSSEKAVALGDRGWRELLERHHGVIRRQLVRFRGKEVDTAGDGFFASFDGPARAIRCACAIVELLPELGLEVRAGLHTGECELVDGKVAGIAVHTGARVASHAQPGEVLVSSTVKDLVAGSGLAFEDRGAHELKGIPGEWRLYAVDRATARSGHGV